MSFYSLSYCKSTNKLNDHDQIPFAPLAASDDGIVFIFFCCFNSKTICIWINEWSFISFWFNEEKRVNCNVTTYTRRFTCARVSWYVKWVIVFSKFDLFFGLTSGDKRRLHEYDLLPELFRNALRIGFPAW